jgi:hypothetical protein
MPPNSSAPGPAYSVAPSVASSVRERFARHLSTAAERGDSEDTALLPERALVEAVIDVAFWASLRREEGYAPRISLALLPPQLAARPLMFERPLPLTPSGLTRLAPAVERPGIHLGVWNDAQGASVWGTIRPIPRFCMVVEVLGPGLMAIKHRRGADSAKFANVAVLEGDQIKIVDEQAATMPGCPSVLGSLLRFDASGSRADPVDVLMRLAVSMRAHGRGGSLLLVPSGSETWRESIVRPIAYPISPPFSELADLARPDADVGRRSDEERRWELALSGAVDAVAGLTVVDGATLLTDRYDLLAFGVKIQRRKGWSQVERVVVTEPIEGSVPIVVHPTQLGNTRHLSAAQFAHDQRDAVSLVASQDDRFTIFGWSPSENMVHAHRIETLLL